MSEKQRENTPDAAAGQGQTQTQTAGAADAKTQADRHEAVLIV